MPSIACLCSIFMQCRSPSFLQCAEYRKLLWHVWIRATFLTRTIWGTPCRCRRFWKDRYSPAHVSYSSSSFFTCRTALRMSFHERFARMAWRLQTQTRRRFATCFRNASRTWREQSRWCAWIRSVPGRNLRSASGEHQAFKCEVQSSSHGCGSFSMLMRRRTASTPQRWKSTRGWAARHTFRRALFRMR